MFKFMIAVLLVAMLYTLLFDCDFWYDIKQPGNRLLFTHPNPNQYPDDLVNYKFDNIPGHLERGAQVPNTRLILFSHSERENLLTTYDFVRRLSEQYQCDVLTWDYLGFGAHQRGGTDRTFEICVDHLSKIIEDVSSRYTHLSYWGHGFGAAVTVHALARKVDAEISAGSSEPDSPAEVSKTVVLIGAEASFEYVVHRKMGKYFASSVKDRVLDILKPTPRWNINSKLRTISPEFKIILLGCAPEIHHEHATSLTVSPVQQDFTTIPFMSITHLYPHLSKILLF